MAVSVLVKTEMSMWVCSCVYPTATKKESMKIIFTNSASDIAGRVRYENGEAVRHCDAEDGFERWSICHNCGKRVVYCFNCGAVNRELSECVCVNE